MIIKSIRGCARCGGNHRQVKAKKFRKPHMMKWTYWAPCPVTKDPILIAIQSLK